MEIIPSFSPWLFHLTRNHYCNFVALKTHLPFPVNISVAEHTDAVAVRGPFVQLGWCCHTFPTSSWLLCSFVHAFGRRVSKEKKSSRRFHNRGKSWRASKSQNSPQPFIYRKLSGINEIYIDLKKRRRNKKYFVMVVLHIIDEQYVLCCRNRPQKSYKQSLLLYIQPNTTFLWCEFLNSL